MSDVKSESSNLSNETIKAIRKEAIDQTAKWAVVTSVAIAGFAAIGWWVLLEAKIKQYIADAAGGVPVGSIMASTQECSKLAGNWVTFKEGTGRFVVGAGTETVGLYSSWDVEGGPKKKLTSYEVMQPGGEESHLIQRNEVPALSVRPRSDLGRGDQTAIVSIDYGKDPNQKAINVIPPYIALYLCKKQ